MGPNAVPDRSTTRRVTLDEARRELPGWDLWHTGGIGMTPDSYSARPQGATTAAPGCSGLASVDGLVRAVRAYEADLSEHVEETRKELEDTPASWIGRIELLRSRLTALEALAARRGDATGSAGAIGQGTAPA